MGKIVYTFGLGSVISTKRSTAIPISINNTQVDFQRQAASESDGHRHLSGTGGQLLVVRDAYASKGPEDLDRQAYEHRLIPRGVSF